MLAVGSPEKLVLLTDVIDNPKGYGRIVRDSEERIIRIVEEKDASDAERYIREINTKEPYNIAILADLQGPKLRVGKFANGSEQLSVGQTFTLDSDPTPGKGDRLRIRGLAAGAVLAPTA